MRSMAAVVALGLSLLGVALAGGGSESAQNYELPPEISRSAGAEGGVVLLWPRIIPATNEPNTQQDATFLQSELRGAIGRALPGKPIDMRPAPERVCPRSGCKGVAVGAVLLHRENGCAVIATVSKPGQSEQRLVTLSGALVLTSSIIAFREPPESYVTVHDFDRCVELGPMMELRMAALEGALREAAGMSSEAGTTPQPTRVVIGGQPAGGQ